MRRVIRMDYQDLLSLWEYALTEFYKHDALLLELGAQERAICGRIFKYLDDGYRLAYAVKYGDALTVDLEYNRDEEDPKRIYHEARFLTKAEKQELFRHGKGTLFIPDIVLHERNTQNNNIFCCEVKKSEETDNKDAQKVQEIMTEFAYLYGINLYKITVDEAFLTIYYRENETMYHKNYIFSNENKELMEYNI